MTFELLPQDEPGNPLPDVPPGFADALCSGSRTTSGGGGSGAGWPFCSWPSASGRPSRSSTCCARGGRMADRGREPYRRSLFLTRLRCSSQVKVKITLTSALCPLPSAFCLAKLTRHG